jgi:hypothetical protein
VVVDETVIEGHSKPYVVYRSEAGSESTPPPRKLAGGAG